MLERRTGALYSGSLIIPLPSTYGVRESQRDSSMSVHEVSSDFRGFGILLAPATQSPHQLVYWCNHGLESVLPRTLSEVSATCPRPLCHSCLRCTNHMTAGLTFSLAPLRPGMHVLAVRTGDQGYGELHWGLPSCRIYPSFVLSRQRRFLLCGGQDPTGDSMT
jgi:hypothetical protein